MQTDLLILWFAFRDGDAPRLLDQPKITPRSVGREQLCSLQRSDHPFCDWNNVLHIGQRDVLVVFGKSLAARQLSLKLLPCPIPFHTSI